MNFSCGEGVQSLFYKIKSFLIWDSLSAIWIRRLKRHSNTFAQSGSWTDWTSATRNVCCLLECRATACPVVLRTCEKYFLATPWRWPLSCEAFSSFTPVYREILHIVLLLTFMFLKTIVQYFKDLLCKFSVQGTLYQVGSLYQELYLLLWTKQVGEMSRMWCWILSEDKIARQFFAKTALGKQKWCLLCSKVENL